ncbi:MAG: hypothetical protein RJB38_2408 [Pseudomonadota bacterium]|jgi:hypothetical protein
MNNGPQGLATIALAVTATIVTTAVALGIQSSSLKKGMRLVSVEKSSESQNHLDQQALLQASELKQQVTNATSDAQVSNIIQSFGCSSAPTKQVVGDTFRTCKIIDNSSVVFSLEKGNLITALKISGLSAIQMPSCGSAHQLPAIQSPAPSELCNIGGYSPVSGSGPWNWKCHGNRKSAEVDCTAPLAGKCEASKAAASTTKPSGMLCSSGLATSVMGNGISLPWTWTCQGSPSIYSESCSAPLLGSCHPAKLIESASQPTDPLCATGSPSTIIASSSAWNWTCQGTSPSAPTTCSAPIAPPGACGSAHNSLGVTAPTSGLCSSGLASAVSGTGPWTWSCQGNNGATTDNCSAQKAQQGTCGTAHEKTLSSKPNAIGELCASGDSSEVNGTGPWNWTCQGNTGPVASCSAKITPVTPGVCGSSNNSVATAMPQTNLCSSGSASVVTGNGPWSWTCQGSHGAASASCSASLAQSFGEIRIASGINVELCQILKSKGWGGQSAVIATFIMSLDTHIGSLTTSRPALTICKVPSQSRITVINDGYIVGAGGPGGIQAYKTPNRVRWSVLPAGSGEQGGIGILNENAERTVFITNNGIIAGGGGGGGGAPFGIGSGFGAGSGEYNGGQGGGIYQSNKKIRLEGTAGGGPLHPKSKTPYFRAGSGGTAGSDGSDGFTLIGESWPGGSGGKSGNSIVGSGSMTFIKAGDIRGPQQ